MSDFFDSDDSKSGKTQADDGIVSIVRRALIVIIPLIVFIFGSYMFYEFLTNKRDSLMVERKVIEQVTSGKELVKVELDQLVANLSSTAQRASKVIRMKLVLEIEASDDKEVKFVEGRNAEVQDIFQVFVRDLRPADLNGAEGTVRLKEELLKRANKVLSPVLVTDVLFKEILIEG